MYFRLFCKKPKWASKLKIYFRNPNWKKYICYSDAVLFRSGGLLLCFGPRKKFHASCDTLSQSNKAFLAKNCQIWVILAKSSPMIMKKNLENDPNLAVFSQKSLIWLTQSAAGCMKFFSRSKTKQKPFWTKKNSVWIANVLFSVGISKINF